MRRFTLVFAFALFSYLCNSQELYVFTEPASNMPTKSLSLKVTGRFPHSDVDNVTRQRYIPEIMFGINKNLMVHVSSSFSNYYFKNIRYDGAKLYAKYRFLSNDDVHKHFRMAAFVDAAYTRNPIKYHETSLDGDTDGGQFGLIATQLVNKLAVSAITSYTRSFATNNEHSTHLGHSQHQFNYSLSAGYLLLPKEYIDYKQTNVNLYVELLGDKCLDNDHYSTDLAPAVQFIFNSTTKINLGYRFQLSGNMYRVGENTIQVALERTILNAWK